jgi:prolyl-tRNA editing enzyme YbaK/EbsC (Cys-tRNA(Pro) deacylase)
MQTTRSPETDRLRELEVVLKKAQVPLYDLSHNRTIHSAAEGAAQGIGALANMAPTFILHTENGFLAAIICGDTRLSYKKIKRALGLKNLCLASPDEVKQITGAEIGYVSLINPGLSTIVDTRIIEKETIFGGCGIPNIHCRSTRWISSSDPGFRF